MESEMRQRAHFTLHTHSMFDIGFSELLVIGIVTLVVVGPERMPKVARTAGLLLGRVQRYVNSVKADISREIQLDELKRLQSEMQESAREFERSITSEMQELEQAAQSVIRDQSQTAANFPTGEGPRALVTQTDKPVDSVGKD